MVVKDTFGNNVYQTQGREFYAVAVAERYLSVNGGGVIILFEDSDHPEYHNRQPSLVIGEIGELHVYADGYTKFFPESMSDTGSYPQDFSRNISGVIRTLAKKLSFK